MVFVGHIEKSAPTRQQFENSPNRDAAINAMIDLSVELYKKLSRNIGASSIVVGEKRSLPSDTGIKFYISTVNAMSGKMVVGISGIHIIPFGKDYMVIFVVATPVDLKATSENETLTRVFNSFHISEEQPTVDPRGTKTK